MLSSRLVLGCVLAAVSLPAAAADAADRAALEAMIARHAKAHNVPESLVHRVVRRESNYNPRAYSRGNWGLMQIRHGTARGMGYTGSAAGLLDAQTNLSYAVPYLANAYKVAGGNQDRAVALYARGFYYDAKRQGLLGALKKGPGGDPAPEAAAPAPAPAQPTLATFLANAFARPAAAQPVAVAQAAPKPAVEEAPARTRRSKRGRAAERYASAKVEPAKAEKAGKPEPLATVKAAADQEAAVAAAVSAPAAKPPRGPVASAAKPKKPAPQQVADAADADPAPTPPRRTKPARTTVAKTVAPADPRPGDGLKLPPALAAQR